MQLTLKNKCFNKTCNLHSIEHKILHMVEINNKFFIYFFSNIFCFNLFIFWIKNKKKIKTNNINNLIFMVFDFR